MAVLCRATSVTEDRCQAMPSRVLECLLDELAAVVMGMPPEVYVGRPAQGVSGSIGEHVRHTLDHIAALAAVAPSVTLSYDHRDRGTAVEMDPSAALHQIFRLKAALVRWPARSLAEPVQVASMISPSGETVTGWSTLARELAFVVSHTIHHQAMIALLLTLHGLDAPERFGYAPSTPAVSPS